MLKSKKEITKALKIQYRLLIIYDVKQIELLPLHLNIANQ